MDVLLTLFLASFFSLVVNFSFLKYPVGRGKFLFLSPIFLVVGFFVLYVVIGFNAYWKGDFYFLGTDFSRSVPSIYFASAVFLVTFSLFFVFFFRVRGVGSKVQICADRSLKYKRLLVFSVFSVFYAYLSVVGFKVPVLHNLLMLMFNSALVVCSYAFVTKVRYSRVVLVVFVLMILYMGFRYRLIFLLLPILFFLFASVKISVPSAIRYSLVFALSVSVVAVVGVTRKYSEGLQLERLEGMNPIEILVTGIFNDTSTVMTSGAIIDWLSVSEKFAYFDQVWYILSYFVPSSIYPDKAYSPIFSYVSLLTGQAANESGAAILGVAEYYHTAGYFGIIFFAILIALLLAHFYKTAVWSRAKYSQFAYFMFLTWFINSMTRGYLPQNVNDLISIVVGLYLIKKFSSKFYPEV